MATPSYTRSQQEIYTTNADATLKPGQTRALDGFWRIGPDEAAASPPVRLVLLRLVDGEVLALASRAAPARALALYRKRWKIETLFGALKSRGFNLEATHLTDPAKLSTLVLSVIDTDRLL